VPKYGLFSCAFQTKYFFEHILLSCSHAKAAGALQRYSNMNLAEETMNDRKNQALTSNAVGRRHMIFGGVAALGTAAMGSINTLARTDEGISHDCEAIHQEVLFNASRKRVYETLTDAKLFDKVVRLSVALQSGMVSGAKPTEISREAGGAFSLFGGHITGRHIELLPDERIVQAWRAASWDLGAYSIVKFVLIEQGSTTKLIFDHKGFPDGQGQHLAEGWKINYWEPLQKSLT